MPLQLKHELIELSILYWKMFRKMMAVRTYCMNTENKSKIEIKSWLIKKRFCIFFECSDMEFKSSSQCTLKE
jgi:hypothetical protein